MECHRLMMGASSVVLDQLSATGLWCPPHAGLHTASLRISIIICSVCILFSILVKAPQFVCAGRMCVRECDKVFRPSLTSDPLVCMMMKVGTILLRKPRKGLDCGDVRASEGGDAGECRYVTRTQSRTMVMRE